MRTKFPHAADGRHILGQVGIIQSLAVNDGQRVQLD
jgi:hypothetical protein